MKNFFTLFLLFILFQTPLVIFGQDEQSTQKPKEDKPERAAFESTWLIENPTNVVNSKGTFEFDINHRFGLVNNGLTDFFGIWAPSNIRLGISYSPIDHLSIGYGSTKNDRLQDFNVKYSIYRQSRSGKKPVSITYYGEMAIDTRSSDNFYNGTDRLSYFHSIIFARRFSRIFSLSVAPNFSHYNLVDTDLKNDIWAVATGGRVKFSAQSSFIFDFDVPITTHTSDYPQPNVSFGYEVATGSHSFQVFFSNFNGIVSQKNYVFNSNDFQESNYLIGFNIVRLWNF